ncbi:MAG: ABC transporter permease subunit [Planctomycetes bacterium]|nr:ABC transporter permease subunit [Planctomycetota bacterium]
MNVLNNLGLWLWHLLPANPILVRVVHGMSRRPRHLWLRVIYLLVLLVVVMTFSVSGGASSSLADLAKGASRMFEWASRAQLAMMCLLAPVFTAAAITQEKDAQTFNILLTTPLSNAQIVFGSLMSRLFFVLMLLFAGLPIFCITMLYGGVTVSQIWQSTAISASTAVLTGSLAIAVSMMGVGTRRTIFSFYVLIAMYLLSVYALGMWPRTWIAGAPINVDGQQLSWLAAFHPFLALDVALNRIQAPALAEVADRGALAKYFIAYPHTTYVTLTTVSAAALTVLSMFFVRRGSRTGETTWLTRLLDRFRRTKQGDLRRKPRRVWRNPVAWREAAARASATSRGIARYVVLCGGVAVAILLLIQHLRSPTGWTVADTRLWLVNLILIEFGTILILVSNTSASAITKEKESQTLDLMLTTPLEARDLIRGKLRGLVSFSLPMIAVPVGTVLLFGVCGVLRGAKEVVVPVEAGLEVGASMVMFSAFTCLIGMRFSLHARKTVQAVMVSVTVLILCFAVTSAFINYALVASIGRGGGAMFGPLAPYTAITTLLDHHALFDTPGAFSAGASSARVFSFLGTLMAGGLYAVIGYSALYQPMVRGFDMTIRRQSGR